MKNYFVIKKDLGWVCGSATTGSQMSQAKVYAEGQDLPINKKLDKFTLIPLVDWVKEMESEKRKLERELQIIVDRLKSVRREFS